MIDFRLSGIDPAPFDPLFRLADAELAERGAVRRVATSDFGFPCRVSLQDATAGDELLLLPFVHQPANSPYRSSGPIYVRRDSARRVLGPGEVPPYVARRLISLRAYDGADLIIDASVREGEDIAAEIRRMLGDERVAYVHLHNANRGCYSCRADRA
jgi:hypothetical protein